MAFNLPERTSATIYTIRVGGRLHEAWSAWLNGMLVGLERLDNQTAITVAVPDQAALRGVLNKLWDLNLTLMSVDCIEEEHDV